MKKENRETMEIVADTFPAGTLSGAPKHRAMQLIDQYENRSRGFYGGAMVLWILMATTTTPSSFDPF